MTSDASTVLRAARTRGRLTQAELAHTAGITQSVVSAYESGRREPSFGTLTRLLRAAGFTLEITLEPREPSRLRRLVDARRDELIAMLSALGATNPRLFGSVARGDDTDASDVDLLVDLSPDVGLFALARMHSEAERILGVNVDVVPSTGLKPELRRAVARDAIPL